LKFANGDGRLIDEQGKNAVGDRKEKGEEDG
jgi:hypothetical protein